MPGFIRLDGTVVGTINSAIFEQNRFGKDVLKLEGQFEGTNDTGLECPAWLGDNLIQLGAMGEDQGGVWVDSTKRVAIWKNKENGQTRWGVGDGNGLTTNANFGQSRQQSSRPSQQQQQRPMTPRPAGAISGPPPQQQPPTNGQQAQQQRPQSTLPPIPAEPAEVTRRRVKATMAFCLKEAAEIWTGMGEAGQGLEGSALQATAATLFIAYSQRQIPLLADPQAPPPITIEQKAALDSFVVIWKNIDKLQPGRVENDKIGQWFVKESATENPFVSMPKDKAKILIDAMAGLIATRESEIEKAKASYVPPIDPPPPSHSGAGIDIPF